MSSKDNPCRKFQANIFNKSKCQNCFKPRESHLLNDEDLNQAKPVYGGWLLLAPEGTNFDNPLHRSRKWQRRFFILYEHGLLRYALDEMPSTLPQGTINMNQCSDVIDAETRTGQKNSLCILTPDKEHFIRAESKEIISGWQESLVVYPRTNKQNLKKKRKVEPATAQEPGPAKVTVTSSGSTTGASLPCLPSSIASVETVPASRASLWQEERRGRTTIPCSRSASCISQLSQGCSPPSTSKDDQGPVYGGRKARVESGYFSLEKAKPDSQQVVPSPSGPGALHRYSSSDTEPLASPPSSSPDCSAARDPFLPSGTRLTNGSSAISSSQSSLDSETGSPVPCREGQDKAPAERPTRVGRGARQYALLADVPRAKRLSHDEAFLLERRRLERRARTRSPGREEVERLFGLERRRSQLLEKSGALEVDSVELMETNSSSEPAAVSPSMCPAANSAHRQGRSERRHLPVKPPDLLNFKKGWMTKLYEDALWKKHWFVLTDQSLRYYRDSIAEEAADLDGEIDLSTCYDVTEFPVQRNYGFQIHTKEGAFTLSAMTSGIRRNWIQAIMKSVRPAIAPDVTRKNIPLKLSVLKTSSLPEERAKARALLGMGHSAPTVERHSSMEATTVEEEGLTQSSSNSEQRRSRIRERRREGRSKTFDWAEFRHGQPEEKVECDGQAAKPEDNVDISSASSSASSPATSPMSSASSGSSSTPAPLQRVPLEDDLERERARRREERRRRFLSVQSSMPVTTVPVSGQVRAAEPPSTGRMEMDRSLSMPESLSEDCVQRAKTPNVQVQIEQRWHQVETTPLREEKQVPISTARSSQQNAERLPPQELAAILDKELEQTQKELARLQEQNNLLQEQLQDARGREQNAREGYVLQSDSPSLPSNTGAWHRLHKLNQDLQAELESQRRKQDFTSQQVQALKRNYSEAKDVIRHHEAEIQALQAKLNNAMAEILISEQAVAKMRSELKLEQERFRDCKEEWEHNEMTLRAQLKDSEDRLKNVEAHLLEKSQALRDLERQQALQRDHLKEVQKLQERLTEVTGRLIATEEAQALKEERLQKNLHVLQENHEKERQDLVRRLAEAEGRGQELEDRLHEAEQHVEELLRENRTSGLESDEMVHQLEEQLAIKTDAIEKLTESIRQLEEEKGQLTCRCQELLNQITEADNEVTKLQTRLKTEETDYYNLEHSYEKVSEEFQKINKVLREKEQEIREVKEMYERLVEKKEQDLHEAMVKMAALGSSLEETELKLQAKEELICKLGQGDTGMAAAEQELQAKLVVAEDRIAELEQHLNDLQIGYTDLQVEHCKLQEDCDVLESLSKLNDTAAIEVPSVVGEARPKVKTSADAQGSLCKRQAIHFSSIHCQNYIHTDGGQKLWASNSPSDIGQDQSLTEDCGSSNTEYQQMASDDSDPEKFISIIHVLETKLYATEEKLKHITLKLEEQQSWQLESMMEQHDHLAENETELQEQLNESLCKVDQLTTQLQEEMDKRSAFAQETTCRIRAVNAKYEKALACVELSREKVQAILRDPFEGNMETQLHILSNIENELVNATIFIREGGHNLEEQQLEIQAGQNQDEVTDTEKIKLFAKTLAFEALVLSKMAFSVQNLNFDLLQSLNEIHLEAEKLKRSDEGYLAVEYADVLTRKLMIESEFWTEVEKLEAKYKVNEGRREEDTNSEGGGDVTGITVISNACIEAELAFAVQNLKNFYEEKLQQLKRDLMEAHRNLQQRELALKELIKASNKPEFARVIQEVSDELDLGQQVIDASAPELVSYMEQIKMEEAHDLADELVSRHLQDTVPSCSIEFVQSPHVGRDRLAAELIRQAEILQFLSQKVESLCEADSGIFLQRLVSCVNATYRNPSDITSSSLCMREAMIQAQVAYVACKMRADHERDLKLCREACQNMDVLCQEHARNVGAIRERYEASLQEERQNFNQMVASLQDENRALHGEVSCRITELSQQQERLAQLEAHFCREIEQLKVRYELELSQAEQGRATTEQALMEKTADSQHKLEVILMDIEKMEDRHEEHVQTLEDKFHGKIQELQHIHEKEMEMLHGHYTQTICAMEETLGRLKASNPEGSSHPEQVIAPMAPTWPMEQDTSQASKTDRDSMMVLRDRIQELETQMNTMKDELENKQLEGDVSSLKEKYQKDFESLKATCERGFAAMEETHQKVIEDLQRQHQREVSKLLEERERLLAEETAATIAAIEAMKNAHREEMEKTQRSQFSGMGADIDELRLQYQEELQSIHRELEVLSEQYSQKCLENAHLAQALEAERQALRQCQRENQELNAHNQELNTRLAAEITRMRSCFSADGAAPPLTHGKDLYELEVLLRVKESEIQYLKQEIHSLKDELQSALRDKKYATDKYKDIYTELSIVKAKADCDISKLKEQLLVATEALGERSMESGPSVGLGYDIMKSKSNPDFLKKERSSLTRQVRGVRSKSLKEGLTVQERMKLFEAKDSKRI
nr:golgin subfamily B member 1-like isoform X5 [Paramormyrops kingsleyae]